MLSGFFKVLLNLRKHRFTRWLVRTNWFNLLLTNCQCSFLYWVLGIITASHFYCKFATEFFCYRKIHNISLSCMFTTRAGHCLTNAPQQNSLHGILQTLSIFLCALKDALQLNSRQWTWCLCILQCLYFLFVLSLF